MQQCHVIWSHAREWFFTEHNKKVKKAQCNAFTWTPRRCLDFFFNIETIVARFCSFSIDTIVTSDAHFWPGNVLLVRCREVIWTCQFQKANNFYKSTEENTYHCSEWFIAFIQFCTKRYHFQFHLAWLTEWKNGQDKNSVDNFRFVRMRLEMIIDSNLRINGWSELIDYEVRRFFRIFILCQNI